MRRDNIPIFFLRHKCHRGGTLVEVLIYSALSLGLITLLLFFYSKSSDYFVFVSDKIKLTKVAKLCTRSLTKDLEHSIASRVRLTEVEADRYVFIEQAEGYTPEGQVVWSADKVCYAFLDEKETLYRWIGEEDELPAKITNKDFRSWPYVDTFEVSNQELNIFRYELDLSFEDKDGRIHRHNVSGTLNTAGGHTVK